MRKRTVALLVVIVAIACFIAGYSQRPSGDTVAGGRKVLYYSDPMNPALRSDKPGQAPCGMPLEPVYSDSLPVPGTAAGPGVVQVRPGVEQLIGVKVEEVRGAPWSQTIRMPGTVAVDENRVYRVTSATDGWVKKVLPPTSDTLVAKDQVLATFYAPEFFSSIKAYLYALRSTRRSESNSGEEAAAQLETSNANIDNYKISLRNLGMSEPQLDEIQRTMKGTDNVEIRSPASGLILSRNISSGQRFAKGTDLYKIADLSRVWILVDLYDNAALLGKPGMRMEVTSPYLAKPCYATLTGAPPKFDPATRTLKLRLEVDNPGQTLRPDMFVNVGFQVERSSGLTVPVEAVLDSGLTKKVFVETGPGRFEPREVQTGRNSGDRVEIVQGLKAGERVVVSGNFLLDSESRMRSTTAEVTGTPGKDPVCGMTVDPAKARAAGRILTRGGVTYYFCSDDCKKKFLAPPAATTAKLPPPAAMEPEPPVTAVAPIKDPICGMRVDPARSKAAGRSAERGGTTYYFCSDDCKEKFLAKGSASAAPKGHDPGQHHD